MVIELASIVALESAMLLAKYACHWLHPPIEKTSRTSASVYIVGVAVLVETFCKTLWRIDLQRVWSVTVGVADGTELGSIVGLNVGLGVGRLVLRTLRRTGEIVGRDDGPPDGAHVG